MYCILDILIIAMNLSAAYCLIQMLSQSLNLFANIYFPIFSHATFFFAFSYRFWCIQMNFYAALDVSL